MTHLMTRDFPSLADVFFKDFFRDDFYLPVPSLKRIEYPVDIYETEDGELAIDIAAIGLEKEDIKIDIIDDVLNVAHEKKSEKEIEEPCRVEKYEHRGITHKAFKLSWRVNENFDLTKTQADLDKGLLKIRIPRAPEKKPKNIEVKIK